MSFLGKLARGLTAGAAGYYSEVAKSEMEARRAEILAAREQALAKVNHDNRVEEIHLQGRENRLTHASGVVDDVAKERAILPEKTKAEIAAIQAREEAGYQRFLKELGPKTRASMSEIELREQYETRRAAADRASREGIAAADRVARIDTNPTATIQNERGEVVNTYAPGGTTRQSTYRNSRPLKTGSSDDDFSGGIMPSSVERPTAPAAPDAQFLTKYGNATPERYPSLFRNGQRIPVDEAWKLYQGAR